MRFATRHARPSVVFALAALSASACGSSSATRHATSLNDAGEDGRVPSGGSGGDGSSGGASGGRGAGTGGASAGGAGAGGAGAGGADSGTSLDASVGDASLGADASDVDATTAQADGATTDATPQGCIPTSGSPTLVAHWSGDSTFDDETAKHNGSAVGTVPFVTGVVGSAFHFASGALSYVDIPADPAFDLTSFTIAGWVRVPNGQDQWETVLTKEHHGVGAPWLERNYGLFVGNSGGGCVLGGAALLTTGSGICSSKIVNDGTWHHLAGTADGCTEKIYVDGTLIQTISAAVTSTGPSQNIRLGAWNVTGTEDLDEVRVYAGAMNATAVAALAK
jgi:hypothetical protein